MRHRLPVVILTIILVATWGSMAGAAGPMPYNLDKAEKGFREPSKAEPSAAAVAADAVIGRPVGLVTTIAGAGLFVITLPFTAPSGSARQAAWELVGRQGGWTFNRPLGRSDPRYEREGIFR
jgi:hypothetical protein